VHGSEGADGHSGSNVRSLPSLTREQTFGPRPTLVCGANVRSRRIDAWNSTVSFPPDYAEEQPEENAPITVAAVARVGSLKADKGPLGPD
jgi:hypothetical protein